MLKRLFWPTIENQYDLDLVGQQGFWVCFLIGVMSFALLLFTGHILLAPLIALTYVLGATGVRERSVAAALLMFCCYTTDRVSGVFLGQPTLGVLPIVSIMLLFANVRATLLARRWKRSENPEHIEAAERADVSFADKLANVLPARVWPIGRFIFFPVAGVILLLTLLGVVMYPSTQRRHNSPKQQDQTMDLESPR